MIKYENHFNPTATPQNEKARADQVENNAGGFVFEINKWKQLDRFLILGCEGGSYHVGEKEMTRDNAKNVLACIAENGEKAVDRIVDISAGGRAPKNDAAIFALALAASYDDEKTRAYALAALPKVCRIGTHLFQFVEAVKGMRGWGKGLKRGIGSWYSNRNADNLAFQCIKYANRKGWSHRDLLRMCHITANTKGLADSKKEALYRYLVAGIDKMDNRIVMRKYNGKENIKEYNAVSANDLPKLVTGYELLKAAKTAEDVVALIKEYGFTHEMIPSNFKNDIPVWEALLPNMGLEATIRNLGKMTNVGLLAPMSDANKVVCEKLINKELIEKARLHPISILSALRVYSQGHGEKGKLTWEPVQQIVDALDSAYYLAFKYVKPTGKRLFIAVDVSGSMENSVVGIPGLSCREAAAALAMTTVHTEENYCVYGFSCAVRGQCGGRWGKGTIVLKSIELSKKMRLDTVQETMRKIEMGGTDCSLPILYALENNIPVDTFEVYTDNETWAGKIHPFEALRKYRQKTGIPAKLVVIAMQATEFSIADPSDAGMLDLVGMDTFTPAFMADFITDEDFVMDGKGVMK